MTAASYADDSRDLALELHHLLKQMDPARWRPGVEDPLREGLQRLGQALERLVAAIDPSGSFAPLRQALEHTHRVVVDGLPAPSSSKRQTRRAWAAFRRELLAAYDRISRSLEAWDIHVPSMRPTNYSRNAVHVFASLVGATVLAFWPQQWLILGICGAWFVWAWSMEYFRRSSPWLNDKLMAALGRFAHPHEWHRVNSATWYVTSLCILASLNALTVGMVAVLVLGFGDPMAAVIGRRFGRVQLVNGRTLEGSLAFTASGALASGIALTLAHPEIPTAAAWLAALAGAALGAFAELISRRVDDNFSIPLSAAAGAALVLAFWGIPA